MRYPNAIWRPTNKHGYGGNDAHLHRGLVIHSAEGSLAGLFSVLDGSRQASWHFSMAQDGQVFQHVDTNNIAWTNGSQQANTKFWGIECEGGGPGNFGEPLTDPQYQSLVGVVRWLWDTYGLTRYERQQTLWEHNEMTRFGSASTSCPSGRIPWARLIADLEDDMGMTPEEKGRLEKLEGDLKGAYSQIAWLRVELDQPPEFDASQAHESELMLHLEALEVHAYDANYHHSPDEIRGFVDGGGTYTDQQAVKAVKDALP